MAEKPKPGTVLSRPGPGGTIISGGQVHQRSTMANLLMGRASQSRPATQQEQQTTYSSGGYGGGTSAPTKTQPAINLTAKGDEMRAQMAQDTAQKGGIIGEPRNKQYIQEAQARIIKHNAEVRKTIQMQEEQRIIRQQQEQKPISPLGPNVMNAADPGLKGWIPQEQPPTGFLERQYYKLSKYSSEKLEGVKQLHYAPLAFSAGFGKAIIGQTIFAKELITHPLKTSGGIVKGAISFMKDPYTPGYQLGKYIEEEPITFGGQMAGYITTSYIAGKIVGKTRQAISTKYRKAEIIGETTRTTKGIQTTGDIVIDKYKTNVGANVKIKTYYEILGKKIFPKTYTATLRGEVQGVLTKPGGYMAGYETQLKMGGKNVYGTFYEVGKNGQGIVRGFIKTKGGQLQAIEAIKGYEITPSLKKTYDIETAAEIRKGYAGAYRIDTIFDIKRAQPIPKGGTTYYYFETPEKAVSYYSMQPTKTTMGGLETGRIIKDITLGKSPNIYTMIRETSIGKEVGSTSIYGNVAEGLRSRTIGNYPSISLGMETKLLPTTIIKPISSPLFSSGELLKTTAIIGETSLISQGPVFIPFKTPTTSMSQPTFSITQPKIEPGFRPRTEPDIQPIMMPEFISNVKIIPIIEPILKPKIQPILKPTSKPLLKPKIQPILKPKIEPVLTFPPSPNLIPPPPIIPNLDLDDEYSFEKRIKPFKMFRAPRGRYSPSLLGKELGITIKREPKFTAGINIRFPVAIKKFPGKKRKKKRRRR